MFEELGGLPSLDDQARVVDGGHAFEDVLAAEAATKVAGDGGVGNKFGADGVEKDLVVATKFTVVRTSDAAERVEGDVQNVIGLVIGEMEVKWMEVRVDGVDEAAFARQLKDGSNAAEPEGARLVGDFVVNPAGLRTGSGEQKVAGRSRRFWMRRLALSSCRRIVFSTRNPLVQACVVGLARMYYAGERGGFRDFPESIL